MDDPSRRKFLGSGLTAIISAVADPAAMAGHLPTPPEIEGPFHPVIAQKDKDFDLTRIEGRSGVAKGKFIVVEGQVFDTHGEPIEDATIDLWQANAAGRYRHPHDTNTAPLDPNFQGWAVVPSGKEGRFTFKTVFPGTYPAAPDWQRPPHIHFKVSKLGYVELTTQMYFPGHPLNDTDLLLCRKTAEERTQLIAARDVKNPNTYRFSIVLQRA